MADKRQFYRAIGGSLQRKLLDKPATKIGGQALHKNGGQICG
jgi:hypothetical protein